MDEKSERETNCPKCGGDPTDESVLHHDLSAHGYLHDDQKYECSECEHTYTHGVPIGDFGGDASDLWCDVCDLGFMRIHRVGRMDEDDLVGLHLKCPHHHPFDCPSCNECIGADGVVLAKEGRQFCPHCKDALTTDEIPYCFYYDQTSRRADDEIALIGYPDITGRLNEDDPYGYKPEAE